MFHSVELVVRAFVVIAVRVRSVAFFVLVLVRFVLLLDLNLKTG